MMMKALEVTLLACAAAVSAFAGDVAAIHEDEALSISVPKEETWTYSGKILGTSSITKSGLGPLAGRIVGGGSIRVGKQGMLLLVR